MMLDMLWVDGLTIRDMHIRRPGYWTVHPTFSNNVRPFADRPSLYTTPHPHVKRGVLYRKWHKRCLSR